MKEHIFRNSISVFLAIVMAFILPFQCCAASYEVKYVSDVRIGYGDEGKQALQSAGYTVWTDLNANENGRGSAVWIGYKTTDNPDEAITDLAVMNMNGGYSFDAYTEEVEKLNQKVTNQLADFRNAIKEYADNHAAGNPLAIYAESLMNNLTDEDVLDSEGKPTPIGKLFLDSATSDDILHKIFLEGNTEALGIIEKALAIACTETGSDTFLSRLAEAEYTDELSMSLSHARYVLASVFSSFHSDCVAAQHAYDAVNSQYDSLDAYISANDINNADTIITIQNYNRYVILNDKEFGDTGMTLLEFGLLDTVTENEDGWVVNDELLDLLAVSMTSGQIGIVSNVGLMTVISYSAMCAEAGDSYDELISLLPTVNAEKTVSVFYEVDRSLFTDIDTVALTSKSLRDKAANEGTNFGKDSNVDRSFAIILTGIGSAVLTAGIVMTSYFGYMVHLTAYDALGSIGEIAAEEAVAAAANLGLSGSVSGIIGLSLGVIALIAGVVLAIFAILKWIEKPQATKIEYTKIPRALVDLRENDDGEKVYVNYYAVKLINAPENSTDSLELYGDLNALNGYDEWLVLYYSTNKNAGVPLTDEALVSTTSVLKSSKAEYYRPIHSFDSDVAANLNQYNTQSGASSIYVFFRTVESNQMTGSVFALSSLWTAIIAFVVGGLGCSAITYAVTKKKKADKTNA